MMRKRMIRDDGSFASSPDFKYSVPAELGVLLRCKCTVRSSRITLKPPGRTKSKSKAPKLVVSCVGLVEESLLSVEILGLCCCLGAIRCWLRMELQEVRMWFLSLRCALEVWISDLRSRWLKESRSLSC